VAGQIAMRLPAGVCRGSKAVRSRQSPIVERQEGKPIRYRKIAPSAYINNKRGKGGLHNDNCDD
jgi:hypothetical protein